MRHDLAVYCLSSATNIEERSERRIRRVTTDAGQQTADSRQQTADSRQQTADGQTARRSLGPGLPYFIPLRYRSISSEQIAFPKGFPGCLHLRPTCLPVCTSVLPTYMIQVLYNS